MTTSINTGLLYNAASTAAIEIDYVEPICNRAKLDTGTHCNYRCGFCYYKDKLNVVTPLNVIVERIDYLCACGITAVDLSGGESSIHRDWFTILEYCKSKGLRISTLSNGYKFADKDFFRKSVDAGLSEVLFSVHGYDDVSHNQLVGNKHGFSRIVAAINNAHDLGVLVRINCTVTHQNYKHLNTFTELAKSLHPFELNFLTLNYWSDAATQQYIDYGAVTPHIHQAIDATKDHIPIINVRYTPYCFMVGYEKYVCNYYQHIYDVYDWNIALYDYKLDPETYKRDRHKHLYAAAKENRLRTYYKTKGCRDCKFYSICDGVEKNIPNVCLVPVVGDNISQVNFYRRGMYGSA